MAKRHRGSLQLDWINKDLSLYYEIDEKEGKGVRPVWVPKNDIRVAEPRVLRFQESYGEAKSDNMLIKGDNLLVLRSLVEMFKGRPDKEKVKCIYIDPPFNTGNAFKYYDDNLQHSEWLTMMRDRLILLKKLLGKDGAIFVHIDYTELGYLQALMDEVFTRKNFMSIITWQRTSQRTVLGQGASPITTITEYVLVYGNSKNALRKIQKAVPLNPHDDEFTNLHKQYNQLFISPGEKELFKKIKTVRGQEIKIYKHKDWKIEPIRKRGLSQPELYKLYVKNFEHLARFDHQQAESSVEQLILKTIENKTLYSTERVLAQGKNKGQAKTSYYLGGNVIYKLKKYAEINDGVIHRLIDLNNLWLDKEISAAGIAGEGSVEFKRGKKPEALIKRIIEMSTSESDIVLDSFAGSGTTSAVAHKMGRRWITVEFGRHAEELIIPRLQKVVSGKDQSGISKNLSWKGGGGFQYYQLGESLINDHDMNWSLKAEEMAEAVFLHFQYKPTEAEWLKKVNIYLGRHRSARYHFAISFAVREVKTLTLDLYERIIAELEKEKFKHLTIFTNVSVAVSPESIDDRVLVRKIPAAILREYNLL